MPEGRLRRALKRLTADDDELTARELLTATERHGASPISECPVRAKVRVSGTVQSVTLRPRAGVPALEAVLYDGSGTLYLVWLGRRRIAGIDPGAALVVEGRITDLSGRKTLFNPEYTLQPRRA